MALLGLLSLFQAWLVPGLLALAFYPTMRLWDRVLLAVPISAVANFFLVYFLVAIGFYTQTMLVVIFAVECLLLLSLYVRRRSRSSQSSRPTISIEFTTTTLAFALLSLLVSVQVINQLGTVFTQGDAVHSWNQWGIAWFEGNVPSGIATYPQLLPTLYSLTYQFLGSSQIELFAKLVVAVYPIVVVGMFARMAYLYPSERTKLLWAAVVLFFLVRRLWGSENTVNGYADFPLVLFGVSLIYGFALAVSDHSRRYGVLSPSLYVIVIVAIGAGLTKQSGLYLGALVPVVWLVLMRCNVSWSLHIRRVAMVAIAIAICSAVWYGFQYWRIIVGLESSNIKQLSELVGLSWSESLFYGVKGLTRKLTPLWVVFLIASLFHPYVRHMTSWMVLPFIVLWATFVPYDYRNLAAIFPLLALSLVYGWCQIVNALQTKWFFDDKVTRAIRGASVAAVCIVLGAVFSKPHYGEELIRISERAKLKMGDPEINFRLLAFYEINPAPSLLATPYAFAGNIPALAGRYRPLGCGLATFGHAANLDEIMSEIQSLQIKQVLLLPWCDSKVLEVFATESSRFRRIFQVNGAVFYEVLR